MRRERRRFWGRLRLSRQILLLQLAIIVLTLGTGLAVSIIEARNQLDKQSGRQSLAIAHTVASVPEITRAFHTPNPARIIQPIAERIRHATGASFVVVANREGIRYSHPNPAKLGKRVSTDFSPVLLGKTYVGVQTGSLGKSVRAKVPLYEHGRIIGLVSIGLLERDVSAQLRADLPVILIPPALGLLLGLVNDRLLVVNRMPVSVRGQAIGAVITLRDRTELEELVRERDEARDLAKALRAQEHDFSHKLHVVAGLIELGRYDEAIRFINDSSLVHQALVGSIVENVGDPALVALLLGKAAIASERGIALRVTDDTRLPEHVEDAQTLISVVGNLVDNALDSVAGAVGGG